MARGQAERSTMAALQLEGRKVDRRCYMVLLQQEVELQRTLVTMVEEEARVRREVKKYKASGEKTDVHTRERGAGAGK